MVIGLDIGASKIAGIIFDGKKAVKDLTIVTPKNLSGFKYSLLKLVKFLSLNAKINAIGVGLAGMADNQGRVIYSPNMKFLVGFNLLKLLKSLGTKKAVIENDANCFALAEARIGQGRKLKNFIGITLGTGIGGGLISNGKLYRGIRGSAGEVGHMMANKHQDYEKSFQKLRNSKNYPEIGKLLGRMFADVYNLLDIEAVILGGSVAKSSNKFLSYAVREARKKILNKQINPKILVSKLKHAGALGAALLVK